MKHDSDKGEVGGENLLDYKTEHDISSDKRTIESQNIEYQKTLEVKSASEHQNKTSTCIPPISNARQGFNK